MSHLERVCVGLAIADHIEYFRGTHLSKMYCCSSTIFSGFNRWFRSIGTSLGRMPSAAGVIANSCDRAALCKNGLSTSTPLAPTTSGGCWFKCKIADDF
jgi:hypothetical protein